MKKKTDKTQKLRILFNVALIVLGLVSVLGFMSYMQNQYSVIKANQTASAALDAVIQTLDENTEKVDALRTRYHGDNRAVLHDIEYLMMTDHYGDLLRSDPEVRTQTMDRLSRTVGQAGYLFVIDKTGRVVAAPKLEAIGDNLVGNGTLTPDELAQLTGEEQAAENGAIIGTPAGTDINAYFYGNWLIEDYYLIYAVDSAELDRQFTALRDLGPILSSVVVGDNGFVFAVDSSTGRFTYYDDGQTQLTGEPYTDAGLTSDVLTDRFNGLQTIGGMTYQCLSRTYRSSFYGEYTVITAVCAANSVFAGDKTAIALTAITFSLGAALILLYATLMRMDPDQLAPYDDDVVSRREFRNRRRNAQKSTRNVRLFKLGNEQFYAKVGIAEHLAPVVAIALLVVFAISWNTQTLVEISRGMKQSNTAIRQLEVLFANRESSSGILMNRYQGQYLSKLQLISFLLEEDPSLMAALNDADAENIHPYLTAELEPVVNDAGKPVLSAANSPQLIRLAENNNFDYLAVYDDQGRTISANSDLWYFTLSRDQSAQSSAFLDVIAGHCDSLIQEPQIDELGRSMQYLGAVFHYYTLAGEGPAAGRYVSIADYDKAKAEGGLSLDGVTYTVVRHRGMVEGGIADATIMDIMESTTNAALMRQIRVGSNGFTVLFDNSSEHMCLWSPYEASIGRTAAEMNVTDAAFSGTFKGFTKVNGMEYFQMYTFDNGYWIATALPTSSMLAGRDPIAFITTLVALGFYLLLFLLCIFSTETEENALEDLVEKRIKRHGDNGMVKVTMPSGKIKYVRTASARYTETSVRWDDMTTNQRLSYVLKSVMSVIVILIIAVGVFSEQIFGPDSVIAYIVNGDWEHSFNYFALIAFAAVILGVSVIAFIISRFINFIIRNMGSRVETVGRLMLSVVKYGSVLFAIFYGLSLLGFSTAGLVTSASIMSIVIGLGSQSLISDILSGIFIVFEGAFRVGDIVTLGDFRGIVVDIGLRTTKIENMTGDIKIFNNSSIAGIINMTKKNSKAMCEIGIEYGADLEKIEGVLNKALPAIGDRNDRIIGHPKYAGIIRLDESAVVLRVDADCAEKDRIAVTRYLNREVFLLFRRNDINIPFPQMTVSYLSESDDEEKQE